MLKITSTQAGKVADCTPNILPCRVQHNGAVNASKRYWDPKIAQDKQSEAYFRGRKLKGKEVKVPAGYQGVIVKNTAKEGTAYDRPTEGLEDDDEDDEEEIEELETIGSFDEIMLWGHETTVEDDDTFAKGMGEWVKFAEAMHKPS